MLANLHHFQNVPRNVLLIKRIQSNKITAICCVLGLWLIQTYQCDVFVEPAAIGDYQAMKIHQMKPWIPTTVATPGMSRSLVKPRIDLVIALGGDGTTLWAASLFDQDEIPPVLGVRLGSLSYVNQFCATNVLRTLGDIFTRKSCLVQKRSRIFITIYGKDAEPIYYGHCVNECAIDRGPSSNMASLEVYVNDHFFTSVFADGLILSSPTGSTAYSMSAGGPIVHPVVQCLLFTPVCPHSLSMRPIVLPSTAEIRLKVPDQARGSVWLSLDGHKKHELPPGHHIVASQSKTHLPLICQNDCESGDSWLKSLTDNLFWGLGVRQSEFDDTVAKHLLFDALPPDLREWFEKQPAFREGMAECTDCAYCSKRIDVTST